VGWPYQSRGRQQQRDHSDHEYGGLPESLHEGSMIILAARFKALRRAVAGTMLSQLTIPDP
jgi:hypothetical protein